MRRADRLFQIIQILRGARSPIVARSLAEELETSIRTIYRDIDELRARYVPIRGEAGLGFVLEPGYDLPPLMFSPDEIEALLLGAQWVAARGDASLARGARDLLAKIEAVVPEHLHPILLESPSMAPCLTPAVADDLALGQVRQWIREQRKLRIDYVDEHQNRSQRTIWPIAVAYFETVRLIVAWCESRRAFRHFRTDRIEEIDFLEEMFSTPVVALRSAWQKSESLNHKAAKS